MVKRIASKSGGMSINLSSAIDLVKRELGSDISTAITYARALIKLLNSKNNDYDNTDEQNFNGRFSSTKTALKPMPVNKGPRKPPGYHQLHDKEINVQPYCSCGICGSGVNCNGGACPNCNADSTNFVQGDPKTKRDELAPNKPQAPQVRNMPLQAIAAILDNKERDDKKPFNKKLQEYSYNTDETKNFEESVEKSFSDPYDEENSDKKHIDSVEQTWKELSGE